MAPEQDDQWHVGFVRGYQSQTFPPRDAMRHGLKERFAVILSTQRPDRDPLNAYFDAVLYLQCIEWCLHLLPYDECIATFLSGETFHSFHAVKHRILSCAQEKQEPPQRIVLKNHGEYVGIVETEWYVQIGGPFPYHDSYTSAFSLPEGEALELEKACTRLCLEKGIAHHCFPEGAQEKNPEPRWRKLLRSLIR